MEREALTVAALLLGLEMIYASSDAEGFLWFKV